MRFLPVALVAFALSLPAAPAAAQFSPAFNFLKAVKERDDYKAQTIIREPGSTVVNTRDDAGDQALHIVTKRRDLYWLRFLLANGADINGRDRADNTPLILAAGGGFSDGVRELVRLRARVDLVNSRGESALIRAVQMRDADSVAVLIEAGADPDKADNFGGMSAREYAQQDGRSGSRILKLLENAKPVKPVGTMGPSK